MDGLDRLTRVSMPPDRVTQTRASTDDGSTSRTLSAINPETGPVTFVYNADWTLRKKTDGKGAGDAATGRYRYTAAASRNTLWVGGCRC
jgi:hypothetical protein